ncbi:hypothetical protein [Caulobacter sp. NIBR1757]|uniref:hypothetical protein n=1 Tax=Caulobacter sp. NIBR1757 TaxID=3016000 RepID=UPI0022EFE277|nr:hypothetical protein [Caulobacter sp. NIBR1757]WGM37490.1 hypothetical protein AMEJIAPC_00388 [Caulobacter sp. NIBR1757]
MQPLTTWRLEDGVLIEQRGKRERRVALNTVRRLHLTPARGRLAAGAILGLPRGQLGVYSGQALSLKATPAPETFAPFVAALAKATAQASPTARFTVPAMATMGTVIGAAVLLGSGALAVGGFAALAGQIDIGLALASHMAFVAILALALVPWLDRRAGRFDPLAIPPGLLG